MNKNKKRDMSLLRVLIVDDETDFTESMAVVLESRGYHCVVAVTGEDAIRRFRDEDFDIAFMDLQLPGKSGLETFLEIREIKPQAQIVMMTAYSFEERVDRALEKGARAILRKPFGLDEVFKILADVSGAGGRQTQEPVS